MYISKFFINILIIQKSVLSLRQVTQIKIMIMENIKTMSELADIINACDNYPNAIVDAAIKANGWKDEQEKTYGICSSDAEVLEFNENAIAVVRYKEN